MPKLGKQIAALREQRGWTQEQLAERAGIERSYVALIERGHRTKPSKRVLRDLAKALRVDVEELLSGR